MGIFGLFLRFFVGRMLPVVAAEFGELDLPLNLLAILAGIVINLPALGALEFYEMVLN